MMNLAVYLDSTYLKTPEQSGLSQQQTIDKVVALCHEAQANGIFAVMIRPEFVSLAKDELRRDSSNVKVGTVIGFHEGTYTTDFKMEEATKALDAGADELDFVLNYTAFIEGNTELVKKEFLEGTGLTFKKGKVVKWIIETAALTNEQISEISTLLYQWAKENFPLEYHKSIFVKTSTGFYPAGEGKPNGATIEHVDIIKKHCGTLSVKAAGGVRNAQEAKEMIAHGVGRIGTSSAVAILQDGKGSEAY